MPPPVEGEQSIILVPRKHGLRGVWEETLELMRFLASLTSEEWEKMNMIKAKTRSNQPEEPTAPRP